LRGGRAGRDLRARRELRRGAAWAHSALCRGGAPSGRRGGLGGRPRRAGPRRAHRRCRRVRLGNRSSEPNVEAVYPLSPVQAGILFHTLYSEGSRVYFQQLCTTYRGPLDLAAYKRAWQRMVDRHAILRTLFVWERQKAPLQVVRRRAELDWSEHDWTARSAPEAEAALEGPLAAAPTRGFDTAKEPATRMAAIRLAHDRHVIVWSFHHLLLDGWSVSVLNREVLACYAAFVRGEEPVLPPSRPYRDYIR